MPLLQEIVHKIELAGGKRYLRVALAFLAAALLGLTYDLRCYKNLSIPEAMDAAQLGRNLAEGRGYTTDFIRPFSLYLLAQHDRETSAPAKAGDPAGPSRVRPTQPDLANPPVYPVLLAGFMKVLPFDYRIPSRAEKQKPFWNNNSRFWRYQPDFLITLINQFLFLLAAALVFFWARRLFDSGVAWLSALVLLGAEVLWRFSVSGLPTMLLLVIFMGVVWCLTLLEQEGREPKRSQAVAFAIAAGTGALVGLGGLTLYAFAWLIIPVIIFVAMHTGARRPAFCLLTLGAFLAVMTPWVLRNQSVSGTPFGTATYSMMEGTAIFPEDQLERSLEPNIKILFQPLAEKGFANLRQILQHDLFGTGGGWAVVLFLAGLMIGFRNPAIRRMRHFLVMSLVLFVVAQAVSCNRLARESPEIHSGNLLVLLLPLLVIYAVSLFFLLLDQMNLRVRELRYVVIAGFGAVTCLPLISALLSAPVVPIVYPPYHPQWIQGTAGLMEKDEWMMSDVPWAVAWYGRRPCVWLTLNAVPDPEAPLSRENVPAFTQDYRPIQALYLTPKTADGRSVSDWYGPGRFGWGTLMMYTALNNGPPADFPLHEMAGDYLPDQLFLSDRKRW